MVTVIHSDDTGRSLYVEGYLTFAGGNYAPLAVNGIDLHILQSHTVSLPVGIFGLHHQFNRLASCLELVLGIDLTIFSGDSFDSARLVLDAVPDDDVGLALVAIGFHTDALAIHKELHLVTIRIGIYLIFLSHLTVPVTRYTRLTNHDIVPPEGVHLTSDTNMYLWLLGFEDCLDEISLRVGLQGVTEE